MQSPALRDIIGRPEHHQPRQTCTRNRKVHQKHERKSIGNSKHIAF